MDGRTTTSSRKMVRSSIVEGFGPHRARNDQGGKSPAVLFLMKVKYNAELGGARLGGLTLTLVLVPNASPEPDGINSRSRVNP
jgi:hypothetical protein